MFDIDTEPQYMSTNDSKILDYKKKRFFNLVFISRKVES